MTRRKHLYYKDLNGLKFIAFICAFIYINSYLLYQNDISITGQYFNKFGIKFRELCLELFFCISTFLVISQGFREYKYNNNFSYKSYTTRRLLKISPVLVPALLFYFLIHPFIINVLKLNPQENTNSIQGLLLFPYNFEFLSAEVYIYTFIIWTVILFCILYFILGLILKFGYNFIYLIAIIFILCGVIYKYSFSNIVGHTNLLYYGTSIGIGIIFGKIIRSKDHKITRWIKLLSNSQIQLIYAVNIILLVFLIFIFESNKIVIFGNIFISITFGFSILEQTYSKHSPFKFRNYKFISRIGRISYTMIMFTPIIAVLILTTLESVDRGVESPLIKIVFPIVTFIVSLTISNIYYNYIESYFLNIKREFKK